MNAHQPRILRIARILLLLMGLLLLVAPLFDLLADARTGIPSDHLSTFAGVAGLPWSQARQLYPGPTASITLLEIGYAVHELVFALLFLALIAIPLRRRTQWAWWACWVVMLANLT